MITVPPATLEHHIAGYQLCAATEGKSPNAIAIVTSSANYFHQLWDAATGSVTPVIPVKFQLSVEIPHYIDKAIGQVLFSGLMSYEVKTA